MMKFGACSMVGAVVAIQTKHDDGAFESVTQNLGNWFHGLLHDADYVSHNWHNMEDVATKLDNYRESHGLHPEDVHKEALAIDQRQLELKEDEKEDKKLFEEIHKYHKEAQETLDGMVHEYLDRAHKYTMKKDQLDHDYHRQIKRDKDANRINELLTFIWDQMPMQQARLDEVCNALEKYVHNFEHGATNWQQVNEGHMVEMMHTNCGIEVKMYEVGDHMHAFCVTRDGESADHCADLQQRQDEWYQRQNDPSGILP